MTLCLFDKESQTILATWDAVPSAIALPNGDEVHAAAEGYETDTYIIAPFAYADSPPTRFHTASGEAATLTDGVVSVTRTWVGSDLTIARDAAASRIAAWRYNQEIAGTMLGPVPLATDRDTQSKIIAVYFKAKQDPTYTIPNWKVAPLTFVTLDNATIIQIGDAVRSYVQSCFDAEEAKSAEVSAATDLAGIEAVLTAIGM